MSGVDVPWATLRDGHCFGCSPHNHTGLRLTFENCPEGLRTQVSLGRSFESYPGVVHGGVIGAICDETMANLLALTWKEYGFTTSMRLRYIAPLLVDRSYTCVARLLDGDGPLRRAEAEIHDAAGAVMVRANAVFQPIDFEQVPDVLALGAGDVAVLVGSPPSSGKNPEKQP